MKIEFVLLTCFLFLLIGTQPCCENNIVKVQGNAEVLVKPDLAILNVRVQSTQKKTSTALSILNEKIGSVIGILRKNNIAEGDYSTSSFSIRPNYQFTNGQRIFIGFKASQGLTVKIRDITSDGSAIGKLIQDLVKVKGINLNGVNFEQTDKRLGQREARQAAFQSALQKALAYESLSRQPLRKVLRIEDKSQGSYIPFFSNAQVFLSKALVTPPRDVKVSASVNVIFALNP